MKKVLITIMMIGGSFGADNSDRSNHQSMGTTNMRIETPARTKTDIAQEGIKNQKLINFTNEQRKLGISTKDQYDRVMKKLNEKRTQLNKEVNNLNESMAQPPVQQSSYIQAFKKFLSPVITLFSNAWDHLCSWY